MALDTIKALGSIDPRAAYGSLPAATGPAPTGFSDQLMRAFEKVDSLGKASDQMADNMVAGKVTEAHDVLIAARESQLAFEMLLEIRNKLLEAYQEIMRVQV